MQHLNDLDRLRTRRHRQLSEYFGQSYAEATCSACDVCLGDVEVVPIRGWSLKILPCVARVKAGFGINHVGASCAAKNTENIAAMVTSSSAPIDCSKITRNRPARLIYQLIGQGVLVQDGDEYPVLKLNPHSWK